jgi:hypothetical protein
LGWFGFGGEPLWPADELNMAGGELKYDTRNREKWGF